MILAPGLNIIVFGPDEDDKSDEFIRNIKSNYDFDVSLFHFDGPVGIIERLTISKGIDEDRQSIHIYDARSKWSERGLQSSRIDICKQLNKVRRDAIEDNSILLLIVDAVENHDRDKYTGPLPYIEYINTTTIYMSDVIIIAKDEEYELLKHKELEIHRKYKFEELLKGEE